MSGAGWSDRLQIARTVATAALIAFLADIAARRPSLGGILAAAASYLIVVALYFLLGRWLGKRSWPRRGQRLARRMLERHVRRGELLYLTERPDGAHTTTRRVWEVVGLSAGTTILVVTTLIFLQVPLAGLAGALLPVAMLWGSFLLVPYWLYARLGLRLTDAVRWTITPLARRYAERWKLSNGTLALLALGATVNAAIREGADGADAVFGALATVLRAVLSILVIAATAVAYYVREEKRIAIELEKAALEMGVRDARGLSDGELLPRVPAAK